MALKLQLNHLGDAIRFDDLRVGQLIVIQRKQDKRKIICSIRELINNGTREVLLSQGKNDYFNWDMYQDGTGWVWRVWALPEDVEITTITNNMNEFPR